LGVKAIPYLARSHYLGIEKESGLVRAGLDEELDTQVREEKDPQFVISDSFEFDKFGQKADFVIAQYRLPWSVSVSSNFSHGLKPTESSTPHSMRLSARFATRERRTPTAALPIPRPRCSASENGAGSPPTTSVTGTILPGK
jgi:hypothetical protein